MAIFPAGTEKRSLPPRRSHACPDARERSPWRHPGPAEGGARGRRRPAPRLQAVREQFWADFASGLGVSPETLRAAIQKVREEKSFKHHGDGNDFTEALAAELGVEPAKVTEAWQAAREKAKATLAAQRDAWVSALAAQLGVDKEKVAAALAQCGGANRFARGH